MSSRLPDSAFNYGHPAKVAFDFHGCLQRAASHRKNGKIRESFFVITLEVRAELLYVVNHLSGDVASRRVEYQRYYYKAFLDPFKQILLTARLSIECSREVCGYACCAPSSRQRDISSSAWLASMLRVRDKSDGTQIAWQNMAKLTES